MQIEHILRGKNVICERCGYEYKPSAQGFRDLRPVRNTEPRNLFRPEDLVGLQKPRITQRHPLNNTPFSKSSQSKVLIDNSHPRINEKTILRALKINEWIALNRLKEKIGIVNKKEFYMLRMKLNQMNKEGKIQMDFQVNRVLIRKNRHFNYKYT